MDFCRDFFEQLFAGRFFKQADERLNVVVQTRVAGYLLRSIKSWSNLLVLMATLSCTW